MSRKNRVIKLGKDESLYDSSDKNLQYETMERNPEAEKASINYANSWRGRCAASISRLTDKLWQVYNKCYLFSKRQLGVGWTKLLKSLDFLRVFLYNEYCNKILRKDKKTMSKNNNTNDTVENKNTKKSAKVAPKYSWGQLWRDIMGILTLFVIVSIAYSSWVIIQGTDDPIHRLMLIPMVAWAVVKLIKQFTKRGDE